MDTRDLAGLFQADYPADRDEFERAITGFTRVTGRSSEQQRHALSNAPDLCVSGVVLPARRPERLLVLVTGTHGIEGYAGSALVRYLLQGELRALDADSVGLLIVHALNPYGFAHGQRVNQSNVDLNRNCAVDGAGLFTSDSGAYAALRSVLSPRTAARSGRLPRTLFYAQLLAALVRQGEQAVRQASLSGQYLDPEGVFWGGDRVQPEIRFFQGLYERLAAHYREVLLIDIHTGYGVRGEAYALFGRADSPAVQACTEQGVSETGGPDREYEVRGDLVSYCYETAKRAMPAGTCNGLTLEIGTHGLSIMAQLEDLYTVVQENQARRHGALDAQVAAQTRQAFRELFCPSEAAWRARAVSVGARCVDGLLRARGFLRSE